MLAFKMAIRIANQSACEAACTYWYELNQMLICILILHTCMYNIHINYRKNHFSIIAKNHYKNNMFECIVFFFLLFLNYFGNRVLRTHLLNWHRTTTIIVTKQKTAYLLSGASLQVWKKVRLQAFQVPYKNK